MIAWGNGVFENEYALNWMYDFLKTNDIKFIYRRISKISKGKIFRRIFKAKVKYIEQSDASGILVAGEIIAALVGNPALYLPQNLKNWVHICKIEPDKELIEDMKAAINCVKERSELKDLWKKSGNIEDWVAVVEELENRLK